MITNFYGPQPMEDKLRLLTTLEHLNERYPTLPQILGGDFNMTKSLMEKKGGTRTLGKDSAAFQNFITNMKLVDMETSNGIYTWNNKRGGHTQVASKLDRFIVSEELLLMGNNITMHIFPFGGSYHWPVKLEASFFGNQGTLPSDLRMLGSHTQISSQTSKNCGRKSFTYKAQKCSFYTAGSNKLKADSKSGMKRNLVISSKLKEMWKRN